MTNHPPLSIITSITSSMMTFALCTSMAAGGIFGESAILIASDAAENDRFGSNICISGDLAAVASTKNDDQGDDSGSVYLFHRQSDNTWLETAKLIPEDISTNDKFGSGISIDGDRMIIGAQYAMNNGSRCGCTYIYERQSDGTWLQQAKMVPWDGEGQDNFGDEVCLQGDLAIISNPRDDSNSGSVRIHERQADGTWPETGRLDLGNGEPGQFFGQSISISGNALLVGAGGVGEFTGAAYYYVRQADGQWLLEEVFMADDGDPGDQFGTSVHLHAGRAVIGAFKDSDQASFGGSAYVFECIPGGGWGQFAKLTAPATATEDYFGRCVRVLGNRILVGAEGQDVAANNGGALYSFRHQLDGTWTHTATMTSSDASSGDLFGRSFDLMGTRVIAGSYVNDTSAGSNAGAAYIFDLEPLPPTCHGDINGDASVDIEDLLAVLNEWNCDTLCSSDVDGNGAVNIDDLLDVVDAWGYCE